MKVTSTGLLTSITQVVLTILVGAFMLINAAVITFYVIDGYDNYQKKQSLRIVDVGYLHEFQSLEFTTDPNGVQAKCTSLELNSGQYFVVRGSQFCQKHVFQHNWKKYAPTTNGVSVTEKMGWSAAFFIVFTAGAFLVGTIPSNVMGLLIPGLAPYTKIIALLFTLPVLLFWAIFVSSAWTYHPSYWTTPDGYSVNVTKVYITNDRKVYTAPESLFDWTSTKTMQERKIFE